MISNKYFFDNFTLLSEFILRLVLAAILGGLVGYERESHSKEAGFRTHILVALGSALIMMVSQYGFFEVIQTNIKVDPSRIAAQVVSGIGFLGAGVIFKENGSIKGLSTAAGLWCVAALGLSIGSGLYTLAILATILILIVFEILSRISKKFYNLYIELQIKSNLNSFEDLKSKVIKSNTKILSYKFIKTDTCNIINLKIKTKNDNELDTILNVISDNKNFELDFYEII